MQKRSVLAAWGRILQGYKPFLSVEITKECPLRCPGCYAYTSEHLDGVTSIRNLADRKGQALVAGVLSLAKEFRPLHVSIVGGEPLVRYRELGEIIPGLNSLGIEVQVVTSAVRRIPPEWAAFSDLHLSVSIDGLQPEHDARRSPATYPRILENIAGHQVVVHCTVTRQMLSRPDYFAEFADFWSGQESVRKIWFSLYTPQELDSSPERLTSEDRRQALSRLAAVAAAYPKVHLPGVVIKGYEKPPASPDNCIFAQTTSCVSADLASRITPCQFGGKPVCSECGCMASAGLASIGNYRLAGVLEVGALFRISKRIGDRYRSRLGGETTPRLAPAQQALHVINLD